MPYFTKKPIMIEAQQFHARYNAGTLAAWINDNGGEAWIQMDFDYPMSGDNDYILIKTLEGEMKAQPEDWIIKGVQGEFYPCKPNIFEATYNPAEE